MVTLEERSGDHNNLLALSTGEHKNLYNIIHGSPPWGRTSLEIIMNRCEERKPAAQETYTLWQGRSTPCFILMGQKWERLGTIVSWLTRLMGNLMVPDHDWHMHKRDLHDRRCLSQSILLRSWYAIFHSAIWCSRLIKPASFVESILSFRKWKDRAHSAFCPYKVFHLLQIPHCYDYERTHGHIFYNRCEQSTKCRHWLQWMAS